MGMDEPLAVLIAEDDPNDALLLNRAFKKAGVVGPIHVCKDGEDAQNYLRGDGDYADRNKFPVPKILITDLKMPKCNGFELLQWVRDHPECSVIPTIILSASPQEGDIRRGYELLFLQTDAVRSTRRTGGNDSEILEKRDAPARAE